MEPGNLQRIKMKQRIILILTLLALTVTFDAGLAFDNKQGSKHWKGLGRGFGIGLMISRKRQDKKNPLEMIKRGTGEIKGDCERNFDLGFLEMQ
jgi:hypothetical protein